jgi:hypothetical protein
VTLFLSCGSQSGNATNGHKNDTLINASKSTSLVDTPRSFVRNYGATDNNKLFAFVGHKIYIEHLPSRKYSFDNGFKAKYLILQKVFGDFPSDTIEFVAYDHYGTPPFSNFDYAMLYVSADSGTYYQQKYMYNDVYKTKDGRWAGTYAWDDYEHDNNKRTKIKPVKIEFSEPVFYPLKMINEQGDTLKRSLPKPYFKKVGDSALAVYGNYVDDLFKLKRDGYLTARGIFKNGKLLK